MSPVSVLFFSVSAMAKLTTAEKIALARQQGSGGGGNSPPAPADPPAATESTGETPAAPAAETSAPAAKPSSTADILAAARAQKAAAAATPAKPAAKPGSTADILAAARAQKAGAGGGPAPAAPAKPAAKESPKAPVSVEGKSVKEMIEAARKPETASDKPRLPKLPPKPLAAARKPVSKKSAKVDETRRGILGGLVVTPFLVAWGLLGAATGAFSLAVARFMMPNVLVEPPTKFKIGAPGDFPPETVITKFKAERGIWVVNTSTYNGDQMIYALASVCTHLGCTPNWLEGEQKYKCPCHGSGFYKNGVNFEGPAPRPLERVGLSLASDGMLEVDKSLKFQQEMGQWEDGASYVPV